MTKGSKGYVPYASKPVATPGYVSSLPVKTTVSFKGGNGGGGAKGSYENASRISYGDKQSGCYGRNTTKEKASAGAFHWKNGTTGTMSEYKQSSTVRVGDKSGYAEVYREERVRNVIYDKSNCSSSKNCITYGAKGGGSYGGYHYDNDDSEDDGSDSGFGYDNNDSEDDDSDSGSGYDNDDNEDDDSDSGSGYDNDDDGSDGRSDYDNDDDGSDGSYGYDSDY